MKQFIFVNVEQIFLTGTEREFVAVHAAVVSNMLARCAYDIQHSEFLGLKVLLVGYVPRTNQALTHQSQTFARAGQVSQTGFPRIARLQRLLIQFLRGKRQVVVVAHKQSAQMPHVLLLTSAIHHGLSVGVQLRVTVFPCGDKCINES